MIDYESFDQYLSGSYEYIFQHINTQTAQNMCYHVDCINSSDVSVARLVCQASGQSWWWHTRLLRPCHPSPQKLVKTSKSMPWHLQIHSKSLWINLFAKELNGHQKLHLAKHKRFAYVICQCKMLNTVDRHTTSSDKKKRNDVYMYYVYTHTYQYIILYEIYFKEILNRTFWTDPSGPKTRTPRNNGFQAVISFLHARTHFKF